MDRPVVVEKRRSRVENLDLARIHLLLSNKTLPDLNVECACLNLAGCDRRDRGIVGTTEGYAFEILVRIDVGREKCTARHEMSRGAALRTKAHILTFKVIERADRGVAGDEHGLELGVFITLNQGNDFSA